MTVFFSGTDDTDDTDITDDTADRESTEITESTESKESKEITESTGITGITEIIESTESTDIFMQHFDRSFWWDILMRDFDEFIYLACAWHQSLISTYTPAETLI